MAELTDAAYLRTMADTNFTPSFEPKLSRHIERLLRIADALDRRAPTIDASRAEDAWISVAERLGPPHQNVLCLNRDGNVFTGRVCYGMHAPFWTLQRNYDDPSNTAPSWIDVTHWMPLPAPPARAATDGDDRG